MEKSAKGFKKRTIGENDRKLVLRFPRRRTNKRPAKRGTRSLDILHVAAARTMLIEEFISFDARQRELASAIGLKVSP